ncbi:MAG: 1,4-alpha-glucan branching protein GlgB [Bacillota bacterium]
MKNNIREEFKYLFHEGKNYRAYEVLGAHLTEENGEKGVRFTVWAPNANCVKIIGNFNQWNGNNHEMKKIKDSGLWSLFVAGLVEGELYKYEIETREGKTKHKADPYGFSSEKRPGTASRIFSLAKYEWEDHKWIETRKNTNIYEQPISIYEIHPGSWKKDDDGGYLNFRELADRLVEYLNYMNYTHVELLPVTEHPFIGSWGYQATGFYAITSRYGNPDDFKYFVDTMHKNGYGVILDWVPSHFCKDDHGLRKFDGTCLYEPPDFEKAENQWDSLNFDFNQPEVKSFLLSNGYFWFKEYHVDGLRVDAVSNIIYLDHAAVIDKEITNKYGGRENLEGIKFLKNLNEIIFNDFPGTLMIAEESTTFPMVTGPTYLGGLGFNYKWNLGWMNDVLEYMEKDPIYRKWHHNDLTFSFMYTFSENFILPLSHDEVVHGKKSLLDKMPGDYWQKFANLRVLYAYMTAHPGKNLLFMGGEFGQFIEWNYKKELDWFLLDYEMHGKMQKYVSELNAFYTREESLWKYDHQPRGFEWIDANNQEQSIISFIRRTDNDYIIIISNFTPQYYGEYKVGVPEFKKYKEIFNSDLGKYGGSNKSNQEKIRANRLNWHNQPFSINIEIPPLATIFIKPVS